MKERNDFYLDKENGLVVNIRFLVLCTSWSMTDNLNSQIPPCPPSQSPSFPQKYVPFCFTSLCVYTYLQAYFRTSTQENIRQFSSLKKKIVSCWAVQTKFFRRLSLPISLSILLLNDFVEKSLLKGSKKNLTLIASFLLDRVIILFKQKLVIMTR